MRHSSKFLLATILFLFAFLISCQKEPQQTPFEKSSIPFKQSHQPDNPGFVDNDMVMYWNEKTNIVLGVGFTQPARTRVFARVQIAVHDALNSIKPKYERYAYFEREQHANPDAAVASAAYSMLKPIALAGNPPLDQWYSESLATIPDGPSKDSGIAVGKRSADALRANRINDGFTQLIISSANPPNGTNPGEYRSTLTAVNWVPTVIQAPLRLVPNWGTVMKPYVIESNTQFHPATAPYAINSTEYTTDYNEVKAKGARTGSTRTELEDKMAKFWSENRPSYMWNNIARKATENKKMDAWKTARLFALLHVCMAESINTVLKSEYDFYYWRTETAIRLGASDGNNNTEADASWLPYFSETPTSVSPPVPSYPNGVAAYAGTAAETLRLFFGTDETSIDITSSTVNPNVPDPKPSFHFSSFSKAARENSLSVMYIGWDFRHSVMAGEEMGRQIANYVFTHAFREQ